MNSWLKDYKQRIEKVNYEMEESVLRGSFDTQLDLKEILTLFRGSINEIKNLQSQVDVLKQNLGKK